MNCSGSSRTASFSIIFTSSHIHSLDTQAFYKNQDLYL